MTAIDEDLSVEIIDAGSNLTLLGTVLNLTDVTEHEIENRIAAGWKLFWALKRF